jgi:hypothetical protein
VNLARLAGLRIAGQLHAATRAGRPHFGRRHLLDAAMLFARGIRHEEVICITETGVQNMTKRTGTPEGPAVV